MSEQLLEEIQDAEWHVGQTYGVNAVSLMQSMVRSAQRTRHEEDSRAILKNELYKIWREVYEHDKETEVWSSFESTIEREMLDESEASTVLKKVLETTSEKFKKTKPEKRLRRRKKIEFTNTAFSDGLLFEYARVRAETRCWERLESFEFWKDAELEAGREPDMKKWANILKETIDDEDPVNRLWEQGEKVPSLTSICFHHVWKKLEQVKPREKCGCHFYNDCNSKRGIPGGDILSRFAVVESNVGKIVTTVENLGDDEEARIYSVYKTNGFGAYQNVKNILNSGESREKKMRL